MSKHQADYRNEYMESIALYNTMWNPCPEATPQRKQPKEQAAEHSVPKSFVP